MRSSANGGPFSPSEACKASDALVQTCADLKLASLSRSPVFDEPPQQTRARWVVQLDFDTGLLCSQNRNQTQGIREAVGCLNMPKQQQSPNNPSVSSALLYTDGFQQVDHEWQDTKWIA